MFKSKHMSNTFQVYIIRIVIVHTIIENGIASKGNERATQWHMYNEARLTHSSPIVSW